MASPIAHLNNIGTNLTSNQAAGVTTTPLNSVPSATPPFYMAFDATSLNSKFEIVYVTGKTATHVNHAATTYAHTTAEEVRMVNPAQEFDAIYQPPQGHLINGKISVTDAAGITVAIKTLGGADPSVTDPVFVRIGDTVRVITAALSVAKADGTNWCNSGSAELATKEVDYFVYLGYNATDGVVIGFSRFPGAHSYDDFSATTTNEKYCAISTITTAAATDYYEVIGRFAATLSAGAGYTWSVPTYTAKNLIQRPIRESRWLDYVPVMTGGADLSGYEAARYKVVTNSVYVHFAANSSRNVTTSGVVQITVPFTGTQAITVANTLIHNGTAWVGITLSWFVPSSARIDVYKTGAAGTWAGTETNVVIYSDGVYEI